MEIVVVGVLAIIAIYFLFFRKAGNLGFWQLVQKFPAEAYHFFETNPHWHIGQKPVGKIVVGPFKVRDPVDGRFVSVYCDEDFMDATQNELSERLRKLDPS